MHYCFVFPLMGVSVFSYRVATPTKTLPVYVVKPIVAFVGWALESIHDLGIIHAGTCAPLAFVSSLTSLRRADVKEDNILLWPPIDSTDVDAIAEEPALVDGDFELAGTKYPILRSEPFLPLTSADKITPMDSELLEATLYDFGSGMSFICAYRK